LHKIRETIKKNDSIGLCRAKVFQSPPTLAATGKAGGL